MYHSRLDHYPRHWYDTHMTGIIDYKAGNIRSVELALRTLGVNYRISDTPEELEGADRLIFPGVGEAKYAMKNLKERGFDAFLHQWASSGKPLLGVCLGSQIIFEYSEEGDTPCLALVPGAVRRFPDHFREHGLKIPHMGWNNVTFTNGGSRLFDGIQEGTDFYFVHSYYVDPIDRSIISATVDYGMEVPCGIRHGAIEAFQFHPEKSAMGGLRILANFTAADRQKGPLC